VCQPNELKREIKKKCGGKQTGGQPKIWGQQPNQPPPPLAIATEFHNEMYEKQTDVTMKRIKNQLMSQ